MSVVVCYWGELVRYCVWKALDKRQRMNEKTNAYRILMYSTTSKLNNYPPSRVLNNILLSKNHTAIDTTTTTTAITRGTLRGIHVTTTSNATATTTTTTRDMRGPTQTDTVKTIELRLSLEILITVNSLSAQEESDPEMLRRLRNLSTTSNEATMNACNIETTRPMTEPPTSVLGPT